MIASFGTWTITFAFLTAVASAFAAFAFARTRNTTLLTAARYGAGATAVLVTFSCLALLLAFVGSDFSLSYVASYSERALPIGYKIAAFWAGQQGSLLLWAWLLAAMAAVYMLQRRKENTTESAVSLGVVMIACAFFAALMLFADTYTCPYCDQTSISSGKITGHMEMAHAGERPVAPRVSTANPFTTAEAPADGHGLNPLLQNPSMIAHPPLLFVGYAGFTIPFAMLIGALVAGNAGASWIGSARIWSIISWLFLSVGILLGAQWAYVELGWGGYWAWDPVENASLLPWLTATGLLHSLGLQRRNGMFKRWNALLIIATFALCIFGTFLTRSGVIQSVHAFSQSLIGTFFLVFLLVSLAVSAAIMIWRWGMLRSEPLDSPASKAGAFLIANVLLVIIMLTTLVGTIMPLISGPFTDKPISVGPEFYNKIVVPMSLLLIALMAAGPLLQLGRDADRRLVRDVRIPLLVAVIACIGAAVFAAVSSWAQIAGAYNSGALMPLLAKYGWSLACVAIISGGFTSLILSYIRMVRGRMLANGEAFPVACILVIDSDHRRYGGQLIHIGMFMMLAGFAGSSLFGVTDDFSLQPGVSQTVGNHTLTLEQLQPVQGANYEGVQGDVLVTSKSGSTVSLQPQLRKYDKSNQPQAEVALHWTPLQDVYVTLVGFDNRNEAAPTAAFQVIINPLVAWIWIGGIVLTLGGIFCLVPPTIAAMAAAFAPRDEKVIHLAPPTCSDSIAPSLENGS